MATFIDLDSIWRERDGYPNENDYQLLPSQVKNWIKQPRTVNLFARNPSARPLEFTVSVKIIHLTLPYSTLLATYPRVYVNFRSRNYDDIRLIDTIGGVLPEAKFVCVQERIQYDELNVPVWIHFKCDMKQVMRFEKGQPIVFQIFGRNGIPLPQLDTDPEFNPDPNKQSLCTFEITPFEIDGDFSDTRNSQPLVI